MGAAKEGVRRNLTSGEEEGGKVEEGGERFACGDELMTIAEENALEE